MSLVKTDFYGKVENIIELKNDLESCINNKGKYELTSLLEKTEFDHFSYNNSPNTKNINFEEWSFSDDIKLHDNNRMINVTFDTGQNWDHTDYRPMHLLSKIYGVNYQSCTKDNPATKCSNIPFGKSDIVILQISNYRTNKSYDSIIFGNSKQRNETIKNIKCKQNHTTKCNIKKLKNCSEQFISGIYYDKE